MELFLFFLCLIVQPENFEELNRSIPRKLPDELGPIVTTHPLSSTFPLEKEAHLDVLEVVGDFSSVTDESLSGSPASSSGYLASEDGSMHDHAVRQNFPGKSFFESVAEFFSFLFLLADGKKGDIY